MVGWTAIIKSLNQIIYITLYNILSNFVIPTIYGQWHPRVRWIANIPNNFHQAPHQLGADTTPAQQITFAPTVSHPRPFEKVTGWLNGCSMVFKGSEWDLRWFKGGLLDLLKFWRKLGNLEDVPWFFLWFWVIFWRFHVTFPGLNPSTRDHCHSPSVASSTRHGARWAVQLEPKCCSIFLWASGTFGLDVFSIPSGR